MSLVFALFAFLVRPTGISTRRSAGRIQQACASWQFVLRSRCWERRLLANLFGYVKLAQFLGFLCIYSTFIAISMLTGVRVFTLLVLEGVESPVAQQLAAVRLHHDAIVRWVPRVLQWAVASSGCSPP